MIKINSLENITFTEIHNAFSKAFFDYNIPPPSTNALKTMLERRGFAPELSFGAFDNNEMVSFTFNGIGNFNSIKTAYDTGTGTIPEYRGKGLAKKIFIESLLYLRTAGIKQYLLEVLQDNSKAIPLYTSQGFEVSREFNFFTCDTIELKLNTKKLNNSFEILEMNELKTDKMSSFWDFEPSWQNSFDSIMRKHKDFTILGAYQNKDLIAYGVIDPGSGDITQIAVNKSYRRQGIGSSILKALIEHNKFDSIKIINTEKDCHSINIFLKNNGLEISGSQFEMIKSL